MAKFSKFIEEPKMASEVMVNLERAVNDLRKFCEEKTDEYSSGRTPEIFFKWYTNKRGFDAMHNIKLMINL